MTKRTQLIVIAAVAVVVLGFVGGLLVDKRVGESVNIADLRTLMDSQPIMPDMELPRLGDMPDIEGIAAWINSPELTKEDLEGKVVLVDFWTYSCINCIRTYPYLKAWWGKYKDDDFILLGVHTPEFPFEKNLANVEKAAKDSGLEFPIALDNDYVTWRNFHNRFWPAKYLFDKDGQLRYTHFGEGKYEETELAIQQLLGIETEISDGPTVDFSQIGSPETYLGWARMERFASPEQIVRNSVNRFTTPETLALNTWGFGGDWLVEEEYSESQTPGSVSFQYHSAAVNIVAEAEEETLLEVRIDGAPIPSDMQGKDIVQNPDGTTQVRIKDATLYELIQGRGEAHLIEIIVPGKGVKFYTFTFG